MLHNTTVSLPAGLIRLRRQAYRRFDHFVHAETTGGIILLINTVIALLLANSALAPVYHQALEIHAGIEIAGVMFSHSLLEWINDGLMAIFFLAVGLDIKREFVHGELSGVRKAMLPIAAALGGMVVPALIYANMNLGGPGMRGWGVPMATDIAFALGAISLLGRRVPTGLKIFLVALAVVDDLGAVVVIALFYTAGIQWGWLLAGLALLLVLMLFNRINVMTLPPYLLLGVCLWFVFLQSGIHATIAGVLLALTIPARTLYTPAEFVTRSRTQLARIERIDAPGAHALDTGRQQKLARDIQVAATSIQPPLQRLLLGLHPLVTFVVLPLFALANAGVSLHGMDAAAALTQPVTLGVIMGLVLGKQLGITLASFLAVRLRLATLPSGVAWKHVYGASCLGGIGFTMSIFIGSLAFDDLQVLAEAKLAILLASLIASTGGSLYLFLTCKGDCH